MNDETHVRHHVQHVQIGDIQVLTPTHQYTEAFLDACESSDYNEQYFAKQNHWSKHLVKSADELKPYFAWIPVDRIKETLAATTQLYRARQFGKRMKRHFKTRFPGANVPRYDETIGTDTIWWEIPAVDDGLPGHGGATGLQHFVGKDSKHRFGYPVKTDGEFNTALREYIRKIGSFTKLWSDGAKAIAGSETVKETLRTY